MAHEDADAGEAGQQSCQLGTGLAIEVIGRFIHNERIGSLPEGAGDLQLFALADAQLVPAPWHVVGEIQLRAKAACLATEVECEVRERMGCLISFLRTIDGEQPVRYGAGVGRDQAAGDFGER